MAKVTIVIEDKDDGQINVHLESVPPFPGPKATNQALTAAQVCAARFLEALSGDDDEDEDEDDE
jgi:hypothetical protein